MNKLTGIKHTGIALAFLSTFLGSIATIVYKLLMKGGISFFVIGLIESLTIVILLSWYRSAWNLKLIQPVQRCPLLIGALLQGMGAFSFYLALNYLDPITFSFLGRNQVTCSLLISFFFLKERHSPIIWLFIATSFIGSLSLAWTELSDEHPLGLFFAILFCLSFSLRSFVLKKTPNGPILPGIFYGYSFSLLFILTSLMFQKGNMSIELPNLITITKISITATLAVLGSIFFYIKSLNCELLSIVSSIRLFSPYFVMIYFISFHQYEMVSNKFYGFIIMSISILIFMLEKYGSHLFLKFKFSGNKTNAITSIK
jgi:drug/metabolite transporter (DMT)-like permease